MLVHHVEVEHGYVLDDERFTVTLQGGEAGTVTQQPFIGKDQQVGYRLTHSDGRVEYIYFNSSNGSTDEGPGGGPGFNTFVYQGTEGNPEEDGAHHFYYLFDPEDWEEPDGINVDR